LPFSRGRVQRELDKSNCIASLTLAIYPTHTQAGSRCPSPEGGYNGNWDKAPGSGRDPHPSPWTIPTQAPVALLPREGTTGTGQEQLGHVFDTRHLPEPYLGRLPLPFSRRRVQRELGQGFRIGSKPSPFPLDHTHRGSRCPSPEGGYNGNWTRATGWPH